MFKFQAKFLQPNIATAIMQDAPTKPTTTTAHNLRSRLLQERQRRDAVDAAEVGVAD
jgi:hypothetical protein